MEIREFKTDEIDKLIDLSVESINACCTKDYSGEQIKYWGTISVPKIFKQIKENPDSFLGLVSTVQSEISGCCFFDLINKDIKCLYVKPKFLNQKVGKNLMFKIEELAKERNINEVELDASFNAIKFYESLGYSQIKSDKCTKIPSVKMKKDLSKRNILTKSEGFCR